MDVKNNHSIKPSTLERVLRFISASEISTRKNISENCEISLVTAGKIVDRLLGEGLIIERLMPKTKPGPRPMGVYLNPKYNCAVLDLYSRDYYAAILNITGKKLTSLQYTYNHNIFIDDNFVRFLRKFEETSRDHRPEYCLGVGIMLSDEQNTYSSAIKSIIDKRLSFDRLIFDSKGNLALNYFSSFPEYCDGITLVYICLNDCDVISEVMINGKRITGKSGSGLSLKKMLYSDKTNIDYLLKHNKSPDEYCQLVAFMIANIIHCYDPHIIVIDSEFFKHLNGLLITIRAILIETYAFTPETLPCFTIPDPSEPTYSARGMMLKLKEMFIEDVISKMIDR